MKLTSLRQALTQIKTTSTAEINKALKSSVEYAVIDIKAKTAAGVDVTGSAFAPYAAMTKRLKKSSHVNLKQTGRMLRSMRSSKNGKMSYKIKFTGAGSNNEKADKAMSGSGNRPTREFFGISRKTKNFSAKMMERAAKRMVK